MVVVIDFGSQTAHLITRRLKELGCPTKLITPENALLEIEKEKPQGIILSGGPSSVYEKNAPTVNKEIFSLGIPVLTICYGMQLTAYLFGGKVISGRKEYGPALLKLKIKNKKLKILYGLPTSFTIWMSHGDEVLSMPKNYVKYGSTEHVPYAFVADEKHKYYGLQFHPEVEHTEFGIQILKNFLTICGIRLQPKKISPQEIIKTIQARVGSGYVIGAVSGGVDSSVAATLLAKAIGKHFLPIFVDNGLMREDAIESLQKIFTPYSIKLSIVDVREEMLQKLQGITDSEEKRKIIGKMYIDVFEKEMKRLSQKYKNIDFLMQGTIFSDVIESKGSKYADKIKSHHNVGGLPEHMKLKLIEPLRELYKDEVRALGVKLGLPKQFVWKQVFPGPGFAVRIRGEVTEERLGQEKQADKIVLEELAKAKLLDKIYMSFPVMTGAYSTAVKGDGRSFAEVIALRIVESTDVMTTTWSRLPYDVLQKISSRIVNEVTGISRVVYDITTKPPATMEWE